MTRIRAANKVICFNFKCSRAIMPGEPLYWLNNRSYCEICGPEVESRKVGPVENAMISAQKPLTPEIREAFLEVVDKAVEMVKEHKRGRPSLSISPDLICDALKREKNVKDAAQTLHVSRGYIYKIIGKDKVREYVET